MLLFPEQETMLRRAEHIFTVFRDSECEIRPHFFLTGPTGSGKTFLIQRTAAALKMPFFEINAAALTSEGVSGNSLSKALRPLREHWNEPNIIFVDEFDKLFQRNGEMTSEHQNSVQDEFLTVLEATKASVFTDYGKYEPVVINQSLFVFAGAFSNQKIESAEALKEAGMRPEFIGRVPLVFAMPSVDLTSMLEAVPHMKVFQDYLKLFPRTNKRKAVDSIRSDLKKAYEDMADIGIRRITYLIHQYFMKDV